MKYFWRTLFVLLITPLYSYAQIAHKGTPSFILQKEVDIPVVVLPPVDIEKLQKEDNKLIQARQKVLRYAKVIDVDLSPQADGVWVKGKEGEKIWYLKVLSPKAYSLGVLFNHFRLPVGAKLYVYSADYKHIRGAFTYKNNKASYMLPIAPVKGDEIILEYHEPEDAEFKGELHIASIAHDYKNILSYLSKGEKGFGDSGNCNININCDSDELWQLIKHSVCKITYNGSLCSGALINNTKQDEYPYLLTANHCINNNSDASAAIFYFNYESETCIGLDGLKSQTVAGATIIATPPQETIDFSLLELSVKPPPPYKPYYAGWNRDIKDPVSVTSIHHPKGDVKKITKSYNGATTGDYGEGYDLYKHWWIDEWDEGTTEGGSSGSPLFDQNGRIIGDLTGGDANCINNYNDYYQQLYHSWEDFESPGDQLKPWLDPLNSEAISLDGFLPYDTVPSNLKAWAIDTIAYLNWNEVVDSANVDFYYVYRNDIKIDSVNNSSYIDTVVGSSKYKYYITAKYNLPIEFESVKSNIAHIRTYAALTLPYSETFENPAVVDDSWYEERSNDTVGWEVKTGGFATIMDTAFEGNLNAYFYNDSGETSKLVLPKFDLSAYANVNMSFYLHMRELNIEMHKLNILYKEADTLEWKNIRSFNVNTPGWEKKVVPLPNLTDSYQIAFEGVGLSGYGICIDSISVKEDNNFIAPVFLVNKDTICIYDSLEFITTIDNSNTIYWNFGNMAEPQEAYGVGPHWVKYSSSGIKSLQMVINDTYIKNDNDVAIVYNEPVRPTFNSVGNELVSSSDVGNQWYLNGSPIDGATNKTYIITEDGDYAVEVTNSFKCSSVSSSKYIVVSGIGGPEEFVDKSKVIQVFPNPNNGNFFIKINVANDNKYHYRIIDINGLVIKSGEFESRNESREINLMNPNEGIYFIQVYSQDDYFTSKALIKK